MLRRGNSFTIILSRGSRITMTANSPEAPHDADYVGGNVARRFVAAVRKSTSNASGFIERVRLLPVLFYNPKLKSTLLYRPTGSEPQEYLKWYYNTFTWQKTTWMGIECLKWVGDMWNYQEILFDLKPALVIEFGTCNGGSALFFAGVMRQIGEPFKVLSVDISHERLDPAARRDSDILFVESSSTDPAIAELIHRLKEEFPGRIFAILDSDHTEQHVLMEMRLLRPLLASGDYLIVEDSVINGHPVVPEWGPGPYEAIEAYEDEFPHDYKHDAARENKFGLTFAPKGYLIRN
jgi:cephalosporin hydroxylase